MMEIHNSKQDLFLETCILQHFLNQRVNIMDDRFFLNEKIKKAIQNLNKFGLNALNSYLFGENIQLLEVPFDELQKIMIDHVVKIKDHFVKVEKNSQKLQDLFIKIDNYFVPAEEEKNGLEELFSNIKEVVKINTGIAQLDSNLKGGGFSEGQLVIIGARSGVGKSAFLTNLCANNLNKKILFVSLEMSSRDIYGRILINIRGEESDTFNENEQKHFKNQLGNLIVFDNQKHRDIDCLINDVKHLEYDCIMIDYLQMMKSKSILQKCYELDDIAIKLKFLAKKKKIPIIALCQTSRDVEKRESKEPLLSDLKDSGSIEQTADIVMFLISVNNKDACKKQKYEQRNLHIKKYRNYINDRLIKLNFQPELYKFF